MTREPARIEIRSLRRNTSHTWPLLQLKQTPQLISDLDAVLTLLPQEERPEGEDERIGGI